MATSMDRRKMEILKAIVVDYITTGEPVGSRTLEKKYQLGVSSATIRNEMADLEELGYLDQLHSSSGRIPSAKGYRMYIDRLMTLDALTVEEAEFIRDKIVTMAATEIDKIMKQTAMMLSELTNLAVVTRKPNISQAHLKAIQLMIVEKNTVLAVIMADNGTITHKVIKLNDTPSPEVLLNICNLLNLKLKGMNIEDINLHIVNSLKNDLEGYDELFLSILSAIYESLTEEASEDKYFVDGTAKVLNYPEFADLNKMKDFLNLLDQPDLLFHDLEKGERQDHDVIITIGDELTLPEAKDLTIITTQYKVNDESVGTINLIGPRRLDYSKVVSIINNVKKELGKKLNEEDGNDGG
ncbi:heat-inducible transcription repressor HrcA [Proteiniclasticum sp. BAD-10]|uniref:Heat-inducible transcription repressor HrcA n=1 Tax=Proteiniclasticum sediminis TaxID=2804028 RepID=A0A941HRV2_9CLOT|nr:heat-inducible transcriptional repressor HrcA [Proteiniclasticum sediminis]MBR0576642.1 heat-inducible transcription repressor HrcA [Proteiniclasticum sediminis]